MYRDMITATEVRVENSFPDAMSWPVTVGITGISLEPGNGVVPMIRGLENWPDFTKPGWGGPLRYTLWAGFKIGGQWVMSGFMQFWMGRRDTGAHPLEIATDKGINNWQANWADGRPGWSALNQFTPTQGVLMALMVTAGDARFGAQETVKERSQIVTIPLNPSGMWAFLEGDDPPQPVPLPPPPGPGPAPQPPPTGPVTELDWIKTTRDEVIALKLAFDQERQAAEARHHEMVDLLNNLAGQPLLTIMEQLQRGFSNRYVGDIKPK